MDADEKRRKNRERQARHKAKPGVREKLNARRRELYALNLERERERCRRWTAAHPGARGKPQAPEVNRRNARVQYYKRRGAPMDADAIAYADILRGDPCSYCGEPGGTIDHIDAIRHGGDSHFSNLTGACESCNRRKHARSLLTFLHLTS